MAPFDSVTIDGRAAVFPNGALVVADLHLGRVEQSRVELPIGEYRDVLERIERLVSEYEPDRVIVAGDLVHAFDRLPYRVKEGIESLRSTIETQEAALTVVAGNHDAALETSGDLPLRPHAWIDDRTLVHHGHERPAVPAERLVIGHVHPAITIEGDRRPCFLKCPGQEDDPDVLVLPAFSRVALGTPVNTRPDRETLSPALSTLETARPVISTGDGPLSFPPLGTLTQFR
ncbi:MAG: metallophosphoesterase [Halodesulfurarchaeum sp.]